MTDVRTISTDALRRRLDQGTNLEFWNVLTDKWFTGEMIPRSRRMPLDTIEQNTASRLGLNRPVAVNVKKPV